MRGPPPVFWLVAFVIGTIIPYGYFIPWVMEHGFDLGLLMDQASANPIGRFFSADLTIAAIALIIAAWTMIHGIRALAITVSTCLIGVSAGLPLFFYFLTKGSPR